MEFQIDEPLVQGIIRDEYACARVAIQQSGPLLALAHSQRRHDQRLAHAGDVSTLACQVGCFWCCYFTIDVRAVEVFRILDFVAENFTAAEQARVRQEIISNSALLAEMDESQRTRQNLKCPFLTQGACTVYAVRPQTCRNYHATNVAGCQQSFAEPDNEDIDPEFAPLVYQSGGAHVDAFTAAMRLAGYDSQVYEFNTALAAAMAQPAATRARFDTKLAPFTDVEGFDVPAQFMDETERPE
jgi:Fe-S-cluster containining protein